MKFSAKQNNLIFFPYNLIQYLFISKLFFETSIFEDKNLI